MNAPVQTRLLRFEDPEIEQAFRAYQLADALLYARWGFITTFLGWTTVPVFVNAHAPAQLGATLQLYAVCAAVLIGGVLATFSSRLRPGVFWIAAIVNIVSAAGLIHVGHSLLDNEVFALGGTLLGGFYAGCIYRMPFQLAAAATLVYFAGYQALLAGDPGLDAAVASYGIWITWAIVVIADYIQERSTRWGFVQQLTADRLMRNVLPEEIAARLKKGETPIADRADEVTVLFADLVNFTPMSANLEAAEVVALLDRVFTRFDDIADRLGLEKIKTIGDAYMVASGLPRYREDHAETAADMALAMRAAVEDLRLPLQIRIGLHSGAVVAGIIGRRKFSYDLWGDTVNTASRLESHGVPGEIQVSEQTWTRLRARYRLRARGEIELKGKGAVAVYFLDGRNDG